MGAAAGEQLTVSAPDPPRHAEEAVPGHRAFVVDQEPLTVRSELVEPDAGVDLPSLVRSKGFDVSGDATPGADGIWCAYPGASAAVLTKAARTGFPSCVTCTDIDSERRPRLSTSTASSTSSKAGELRK